MARLGGRHTSLLDIGGSLASGSLLLEDKTRVAKHQGDGSQKDEDTLEDNEGGLVRDDLTRVALPKLGDTVGATREDEQDSSRDTAEEGGHPPSEVDHAAGAPVAEHVIDKGDDEEEDDDDLEDQTGHGDVDAHITAGVGIVGIVAAAGLGGQGTTGSLEDQTDNIGGDENPDKELRLEARQVGCEEDDGFVESDIDGGRVEDGCDGKTD